MHERARDDGPLMRERARDDGPSMHERARGERPTEREEWPTMNDGKQKQRGRKRKWNRMKLDVLKDVGGGIPCLVHDKALTGCLPMGCHHCENNGGLHCGNKDGDTGNAQLCTSFFDDGQC